MRRLCFVQLVLVLAFSNPTFDLESAPSRAGKGTANKMQDLKTEAGGNVSYPDRV